MIIRTVYCPVGMQSSCFEGINVHKFIIECHTLTSTANFSSLRAVCCNCHTWVLCMFSHKIQWVPFMLDIYLSVCTSGLNHAAFDDLNLIIRWKLLFAEEWSHQHGVVDRVIVWKFCHWSQSNPVMLLVVAKGWDRLLHSLVLLFGLRLNLVAECGRKSGIDAKVDANSSLKLSCKLLVMVWWWHSQTLHVWRSQVRTTWLLALESHYPFCSGGRSPLLSNSWWLPRSWYILKLLTLASW